MTIFSKILQGCLGETRSVWLWVACAILTISVCGSKTTCYCIIRQLQLHCGKFTVDLWPLISPQSSNYPVSSCSCHCEYGAPAQMKRRDQESKTLARVQQVQAYQKQDYTINCLCISYWLHQGHTALRFPEPELSLFGEWAAGIAREMEQWSWPSQEWWAGSRLTQR